MAGKFVLWLEGKDDSHAMYHLLSRHSVPIAEQKRTEEGKISIQPKGGAESLVQSLQIRLKLQDSEHALDKIGIIVDADADLQADGQNGELEGGLVRRWQALRTILLEAGYLDVPEVPDYDGTIVGVDNEDRPTVGIWLMPNNRIPGKLENFIRLLIPENDTLWLRAVTMVQDIPTTERRFRGVDDIKAHVHTWLAWQKEPGKPIGQAIRKGFLQHDSPQAMQLVSWVRRLFALEL